MSKNVKSIIYYMSIICPILDIVKGFCLGVYDGIKKANDEYKELKDKTYEEIVSHKSVLDKDRKLFERIMKNDK